MVLRAEWPYVGLTAFGEVRVCDSGPGIAACEQAAIFEPYYRSDTTMQAPGVGLGPAISQGLVRQMGGELEVHSELGVGSEFVLRFPLHSPRQPVDNLQKTA